MMTTDLAAKPANDTTHAARFPEPKAIMVLEIRDRDRKRFGRTIPGEVAEGQHAEIIPGRRIRLFGVEKAGRRYVKDPVTGKMVPNEERLYRRDFRIGDTAEVGSYNLIYTGTITAISEKTITVVEYHGTPNAKTYRMSLHEFNRRNWDFDADKAAEHNAEEMMCI